jgi:hypothetical protein
MTKDREIKRLSAKQKTEYERLKKNVKSKIYRTKKNYGIDISGEIEIPSLDSFKTYKQLDEWKEKASSITNRHNTKFRFKKNVHGVVHTLFEQRQGEKLYKEAKRNAEKEKARLEQKPVIVNGKVVGNQAQKGVLMKRSFNPRIGKVEPFDINNFKTRMGLENRLDQLKKRSDDDFYDKRMSQMQENWLDSMSGSFNNLADDVLDSIKRMSPDDFYEFYLMFEGVMSFELYDSEGQFVDANEGTLEKIRSYLQQYESDEMNPLFGLRNRNKG